MTDWPRKVMGGLVFIVVTTLTASLTAAEITHRLNFSPSDVLIVQDGDYVRVELSGCDLTEEVGKPQLPERLLTLALPAGARVVEVSYSASSATTIATNVRVYPAQPPQPYSLLLQGGEKIPFTEPDRMIYASDRIYPEERVRTLGQGIFKGMTVAEIAVRPLLYEPLAGRLLLTTEIDVKVVYKIEGSAVSGLHHAISDGDAVTLVKALVDNDADVESLLADARSLNMAAQEGVMHEYVLIAPQELVPYFQPLADWKKQKGLSAEIVTAESIYSTYDGSDNAAKVRKFLQYAYEEWGTRWVLLGGDTNYMPYRAAYAMDCLQGAQANAIPCDLYFSDIDVGDWNANKNSVYGETDDKIDLYADIFVGRAAVSNSSEAQAFVNKVLTYEVNPPRDYQQKALFAAEILWSNPYTNSGIGKDLIDELYVPEYFQISKLYEALGNESVFSVVNELNRGKNLVNHDGHANTSYMGVGSGGLSNGNMDGLSNSSRYSVLYSIGCYPANFEGDCIAEHFVNNPNGGGVAFIGNSRYGWGSPGNPKYGYSDRFDQQFYRFLFQENITNIGQTLAMAKAHYAPYSRQENVYRWCQYEVTLLGDPEMPIWTDTPRDLSVGVPARVGTGENPIMVAVSDEGEPVGNARVCVMQGSDVYQSGFTDAAGYYSTLISPVSPAESLKVTVTARNYIPHVTSVAVVDSGPYVVYYTYTLDDSAGNADGLANPGEEISLDIRLHNYGSAAASNVAATLRSANGFAAVVDSTANYGDVSTDSLDVPAGLFTVQTAPQCVDGTLIDFSLVVSDGSGATWTSYFTVPIAAPVLAFEDGWLDAQSFGNGNKLVDPGERAEVHARFTNRGSAVAEEVTLAVASQSGGISIVDSPVVLGTLEPDSSVETSFLIDVDAAAAIPIFPVLHFTLQAQNGYEFTDSTALIVGVTGFADDVEGATSSWSHSGTNDLWHISGQRKNSGSYSWYCGNEQVDRYYANMSASLVSQEFYLAPHSQLVFWAWYDVALYSQNGYAGDGLYVEMWDGTAWMDLDFIGTGGALDSTLMGNSWLEYRYDLSSLAAGQVTKIRFRFISDPSDEYEGVYVDDIVVESTLLSEVENTRLLASALPGQFDLSTNYPNPFNPTTGMCFQIPERSQVKIVVYNIVGRTVRVLVDAEYTPGIYYTEWNGTNEDGMHMPSGVYFYRLLSGNESITRKMLLLR